MDRRQTNSTLSNKNRIEEQSVRQAFHIHFISSLKDVYPVSPSPLIRLGRQRPIALGKNQALLYE